METAVRSYLTAGVALAGAGVIAVSPVMPTPTDIQLPAVHASSAAVELSALTNPLDAWAQTLSNASANLQTLGEQLLASDAPILRTVISNQIGNATVVGNAVQTYADNLTSTLQGLPAALQTASDLISQGQITDAVDGLTLSLLPAILGLLDLSNNSWTAVTTTTQNLANVIAAVPTIATAAVLPAVFPLLSVLNGVAATAQEVATAANAGDTEGVANALINAPANLTDAFLNGKGTILGIIPVAGLLSPSSPLGALGSGPIASLLDIPKTIAGLLDPNPLAPATTSAAVTSAKLSTSAVSTLSSGTSARSVTLSVPAGETAAAPEAVATSADSTDATAPATQADDSTSASTSKATPKATSKASNKVTGSAKQVRDNLRKATQRIAGKTGKSADSTSTDGAKSAAGKSDRKSGGKHHE
ncbi:hypothetical protein HGA11_12835 [Mycolicibacterium septicum DSM 44393]|uniref:PE-PGRS family protein n=1 Tax=Mycolicibacterium septicum DSM 44393 TaxID=1341646 RepID=A0A7X6MN77_9MYCO|nr:hypothetical protein [Mycolicibacterium septicum]NKZ11867.1 hypothetical protein [Mycolicibacterium septicum DSM 44393]